MLTPNHSHPVSLAQSFHSCSCLQFLFSDTRPSAAAQRPTPKHGMSFWPFQKLLISLHKVCCYYCDSSSPQFKLQRAVGNEAINRRGETEKAAQPKRKPKVQKRNQHLVRDHCFSQSELHVAPTLTVHGTLHFSKRTCSFLSWASIKAIA